jgi:hypothetical protein
MAESPPAQFWRIKKNIVGIYAAVVICAAGHASALDMTRYNIW